MKFEEYVASLPAEIMSGDAVQLSDDSFRDAFDLLGLGADDAFYHLGCGNGRGAIIAADEYGVRRSVGVDSNRDLIEAAAAGAGSRKNLELVCGGVEEADLADATAVLFWFADLDLVYRMVPNFRRLRDGCRVATLWGPLPGCLPDEVRFPYVLSRAPFRRARDLREQVLAVFGVDCVDFATAWEHAERYTKAIELPGAENNRFVTIIQSLTIWINAKNLGVACGDGIPDPIRAYMGILENFYGIEVAHLLEGGGSARGG